MNDITLRQMKIFSLVVDQGSFVQCAEFLNISPVAVGTHIKKLESRLNITLFDRPKGETVRLTKQGEHYYKRILIILEEIDSLQNEAGVTSGHQSPLKLRVGIDPFVFQRMERGIEEVKSKYTQIKFDFNFEARQPERIDLQLRQRSIDIGYFYASAGAYHDSSVFIMDEPLGIFVGKSHPLVSKQKVTLKDLAKVPAILGGENNYFRKLSVNALDQAGLSGFPVLFESDHLGLMLSSLSENKGFLCMLLNNEKITPSAKKRAQLELNFGLSGLQLRQRVHSSLKYNPIVNDVLNILKKSLIK